MDGALKMGAVTVILVGAAQPAKNMVRILIIALSFLYIWMAHTLDTHKRLYAQLALAQLQFPLEFQQSHIHTHLISPYPLITHYSVNQYLLLSPTGESSSGFSQIWKKLHF